MTFRELRIGDKFLFESDLQDAPVMEKVGNGLYRVCGWTHHVPPERRNVDVVRIETTPKEESREDRKA